MCKRKGAEIIEPYELVSGRVLTFRGEVPTFIESCGQTRLFWWEGFETSLPDSKREHTAQP